MTPRTRLLALSHVLWTTGRRLDLHQVKRESGLPVLVDGAQSVGAIPVDVGGFDFYTVSGQKWLCGPDPPGALYVREPERLRIALPSYFAQTSIELDGAFEPKPGAARFDSGWLAVPALAGLEAALDGAPGVALRARCGDGGALPRAPRRGRRGRHAPGQATLVSFRPTGDPPRSSPR